MIKLGERRINPGHIVQYYPSEDSDHLIIFELTGEATEAVSFDSKKSRDAMLVLVDKYLISFDDGTIIASTMPNFPFILGGPGEEGPGGVGSMH